MMGRVDKVVLSQLELESVQSALVKSGSFFIAGAVSIYVPEMSTKFLLDKATQAWPNLDYEYEHMTPGEAARTELKREFPHLVRVGWRKQHIQLFDKTPPHMFYGEGWGNMVYLDMIGAYHQLYKRLWLDGAYPRGIRGRYKLGPVADRLEQWKTARNSVIGISRSRVIVGVRGTKRMQMQAQNKYLSPCLWATVQDLLHWIAGVAIEMGAIYVNTDGYIFLMDKYQDFWDWATEQGILLDMRASGFGHIRGWNSYRIGNYQTKVYERNLPFYAGGFNNVQERQPKWGKFWRLVRFRI